MIEISEEKKWALDFENPVEFEHEFKRRYPLSDVLPVREEWLGIPAPTDRGINGVRPEDYEVEGRKVKQEPPPEAEPEKFYCRGCKKEFKYRVAQAGHERKCKVLLNTRL